MFRLCWWWECLVEVVVGFVMEVEVIDRDGRGYCDGRGGDGGELVGATQRRQRRQRRSAVVVVVPC